MQAAYIIRVFPLECGIEAAWIVLVYHAAVSIQFAWIILRYNQIHFRYELVFHYGVSSLIFTKPDDSNAPE